MAYDAYTIDLHRLQVPAPRPLGGYLEVDACAAASQQLPARLRSSALPYCVLVVMRGEDSGNWMARLFEPDKRAVAADRSRVGFRPLGAVRVVLQPPSGPACVAVSDPDNDAPRTGQPVVDVVLKVGKGGAGDWLHTLQAGVDPAVAESVLPSLSSAPRSAIVGGEIRLAFPGGSHSVIDVFATLHEEPAHRHHAIPARGQHAGVVPLPVGQRPADYHGEPSHAEAVKKHYQAAGRYALTHPMSCPERPEEDRRMATLQLGGYPSAVPAHRFLCDGVLVDEIEAASLAKGADLSQDVLLRLALAADATAVRSAFEGGAINDIHASYYATRLATKDRYGVAQLFADNRLINRALGGLLARLAPAGEEVLRIKGLCNGPGTAHWTAIAQGARQHGIQALHATLTDFFAPDLPAQPPEPTLTLSSARQSLFDPFDILPPERRHHALIATYGFDSIWLPQDLRLQRIGDAWYRFLYRVKVADWNPRKEELLAALRAGQPLADATAFDYDGIFVEEAAQAFDIAAHPYARYLEDRVSDRQIISFPGGMIETVAAAFRSQLREDGAFVVGDVVQTGGAHERASLSATLRSGVCARYKVDDYEIAATILRNEHGLRVEILSLRELARLYLPRGWESAADAAEREPIEDNPSNVVMVVRR